MPILPASNDAETTRLFEQVINLAVCLAVAFIQRKPEDFTDAVIKLRTRTKQVVSLDRAKVSETIGFGLRLGLRLRPCLALVQATPLLDDAPDLGDVVDQGDRGILVIRVGDLPQHIVLPKVRLTVTSTPFPNGIVPDVRHVTAEVVLCLSVIQLLKPFVWVCDRLDMCRLVHGVERDPRDMLQQIASRY